MIEAVVLMAVREYDANAKLWLCDWCGEWNVPEDDKCGVCDEPKHLPLKPKFLVGAVVCFILAAGYGRSPGGPGE